MDLGRMFAERSVKRPVRGMSASVQLFPMYMNSMSGLFSGTDASRLAGSLGETLEYSSRRREGMNVDAVWKGCERAPRPVRRYFRSPLTMRAGLTSRMCRLSWMGTSKVSGTPMWSCCTTSQIMQLLRMCG